MSKVIKSLKIIGLVLGIILALGVILCLISLWSKNFYLFGYKFVKNDKATSETVIAINGDVPAEKYNVNIVSNSYNISIIGDENLSGWISYKYTSKEFGFASILNSRLVSYKTTDSITLTMRETTGWLSYSNCDVIIVLNSNYLYNLSVQSEEGDIYVKNVNIDNFNLKTKSGNITVEPLGTSENKVLNLNILSIETDKGLVNFELYELVTVDNNSEIILGNGKIYFKDINSSILFRGKEINFKANNIIANKIEVVCFGGEFSANNVTVLDDFIFISDKCNLNLNTLTSNVYISTISGNVNIINIEGSANIKTKEGSFTNKRVSGNIYVITTSGNIIVDKYYAIGQFTTKTGNITVNSLSEFDVNLYTTISTDSGKIVFENNINKSDVTVSGKVSAIIKIWNVAQSGNVEHRVSILNGNAEIGIMAKTTDVFRIKRTGNSSGTIYDGFYYAIDEFIYYPTMETYSNQASFICNGGTLKFAKLDQQF